MSDVQQFADEIEKAAHELGAAAMRAVRKAVAAEERKMAAKAQAVTEMKVQEAVAAERLRWQVAVEAKLAAAFQHGWTWTKIRDEIFATTNCYGMTVEEIADAIRKGG